ncbi:MAG TPA: class II glutamine amidotransferase, partial [Thermoplasmata archaeon]|nr:class II glutamine amidotransferase [Thermoplasmata archaeon]
MCRLFGLLGSAPTPAAQWLVSSDRSLLRQSNGSSRQLQDDGWGIAWFDGSGELTVEKGVGGAHASGEVGRFKAAADRAVGPVVLAHLRKASNPMRLPKDRLIALENSQPFTYGRTMFAHNGSILHPRETRPLLGRYEREVRGVNDSEVLFALLLRNLDETREPVAAYAKTVGDLFQVWHRLGA